MKEKCPNTEITWEAFKRIIEIIKANPGILTDADAKAQMSPEERELLEGFSEKKNSEIMSWWAAKYQDQVQEVYRYIAEKSSTDKISNTSFESWYERQNARNRFQSSMARHMKGLYYIPIAFELSDGCSVGCNFCCLSAERLSKVYRYTDEHANEWQQILKTSRDVLGDIAGAGICYFATEPFDNPDYEKFIRDFRTAFGYCPQTTTATADRNVERARSFMKELGDEELSKAALRFSVTSLKQLERIYHAFTPRELKYVELLMNNPESSNMYSRAGRSIELSDTLAGKAFSDDISSACIMGFIVNLPRRTITLAYSHRPDSLHPKGMQICDHREFTSVDTYKSALLSMIEQNMPVEMPMDSLMKLHNYISVEKCGYRLKISGDRIHRSLTLEDLLQKACEMLFSGKASINEILSTMHLSEEQKKKFIDTCRLLYQSGYIDTVQG